MRHALIAVITLAALAAVSASATDYYVAQNGQNPESPYTSWATAASNMQYAVDAAPPGKNSDVQHTVWVAPGHYFAPTNAASYADVNTNVVLINDKGITLQATSTNPADTIIDGGGTYRGLTLVMNRETTNRIVVSGFTISNCHVSTYGGGMFFYGNSHGWTGVVQNCVITHNSADTRGGGLACHDYAPSYERSFSLIVADCLIKENTSLGTGGGGMYCSMSGYRDRAQIRRCRIENNQASNGGGIYSSFADLEDCVIRNNTATDDGGGVYNNNNWVTLKNTLICNNVASEGGAVYYRNTHERSVDELQLDNCTIVSNSAGVNGAIRLYSSTTVGQVRIRNSIVYSNATVDFYNDPDLIDVTLTTSCMSNTNGFPGSGNITNNPGFADFAGQNFRLAAGSPCLNTGTYQSWMDDTSDLDGNPRVDTVFRRVDMGCYEHRFAGTILMLR